MDRIKQKVEQKVDEKVDKKVDETLGDKQAAQPSGTEEGASASSTAPTSRKEWANYDFVPGARTIFFTDFTEDQVGNFPKRLTFETGQMEIVELDGGQRALEASSPSELLIPLPEALPQKFTIELDVINRNSMGVGANTFESEYAVDAGQLTAKGYGDTKPVAKNATPEGRANNRRVEIVKL